VKDVRVGQKVGLLLGDGVSRTQVYTREIRDGGIGVSYGPTSEIVWFDESGRTASGWRLEL
jgi:hypothetical protein